MSETWGSELSDWQKIIDFCELSLAGISRKYDVAYKNLTGWFYHGVVPQKKSKERMEAILSELSKTTRIPYSPVWGYATPAQIERLKSSISTYEREQIMKQIEKQTSLKGKVD